MVASNLNPQTGAYYDVQRILPEELKLHNLPMFEYMRNLILVDTSAPNVIDDDGVNQMYNSLILVSIHRTARDLAFVSSNTYLQVLHRLLRNLVRIKPSWTRGSSVRTYKRSVSSCRRHASWVLVSLTDPEEVAEKIEICCIMLGGDRSRGCKALL
jgi:hypothetical protein